VEQTNNYKIVRDQSVWKPTGHQMDQEGIKLTT